MNLLDNLVIYFLKDLEPFLIPEYSDKDLRDIVNSFKDSIYDIAYDEALNEVLEEADDFDDDDNLDDIDLLLES